MRYDKLELGQIEALVNIIGGLEVVMQLLRGTAKVVITILKHIVDMDVDPYIPDGWTVESHKKQRQLELDPKNIQLYLSKSQKLGKYVKGDRLRKELESQPVLNANALDYLLVHPELIPESWKGKAIFFWGTIYRHSDGDLFVRCLCFNGERWDWDADWLGGDFDLDCRAAVAGEQS